MNPFEDAVACLKPAVPLGTRLIVFGSHACGGARADSDIDLLVAEPETCDRYPEMARLSTLLGRRLIPADVVVMSADAFQRQKSVTNTLAWRAAREGRVRDCGA